MKLSSFSADIRDLHPEVQTLYDKLVFSYNFDEDKHETEPSGEENFWIRTETNHNAFVEGFVIDESKHGNNGVLAPDGTSLLVLDRSVAPQQPSQV